MENWKRCCRISGIIIQPYWRKLYHHSKETVKDYDMHPTFEMISARSGSNDA